MKGVNRSHIIGQPLSVKPQISTDFESVLINQFVPQTFYLCFPFTNTNFRG